MALLLGEQLLRSCSGFVEDSTTGIACYSMECGWLGAGAIALVAGVVGSGPGVSA
jgi:hypothetical protein